MRRFALLTGLLVSLSANAATLKLALPELNSVQLDAKIGAFLTEQLGLELQRRGAEVVTAREIASLLGYERQKQLLNCDEKESSCVAELGNALGADALIVGDAARIGTRYQLTVKALSTATGKSVASWSGGTDAEEGLLGLVKQAAAALLPELSKVTGRELGAAVVVAEEKPSMRRYALYPAVAGGVILAGAIACEAVAFSKYNTLNDSPPSEHQAAVDLANSGKTFQGIFAVGATVGVAALATAGALYLFGGEETSVSATIVPGGAAVAVSGAFP